MICPTDYLEPVISNRFDGRKYYYSSLGNTFTLDRRTLKHVSKLISENNVREVLLVLSENNRIVLDAMERQKYLGIRGLKRSYLDFEEHNQRSQNSGLITANRQKLLLSYHLNKKIEELSEALKGFAATPIEIKGKIFSNDCNSFQDIDSNLVCNNIHLN